MLDTYVLENILNKLPVEEHAHYSKVCFAFNQILNKKPNFIEEVLWKIMRVKNCVMLPKQIFNYNNPPYVEFVAHSHWTGLILERKIPVGLQFKINTTIEQIKMSDFPKAIHFMIGPDEYETMSEVCKKYEWTEYEKFTLEYERNLQQKL
jgi:hypothetical protein